MKTDQEQKEYLKVNEVHIWRFDLNKETAYLNEYSTVLSLEEREAMDRLIQPLHRQRAMAARIQLRMLLASYLDEKAESISFLKGEFGKPYIAGSACYFNFSHSHNTALLALSQTPNMGVDVECWRPLDNREGIVQRHYSALEKQQWEAIKEADKEKVFFDNWTRKEAFIKATGRGLGMGLSTFSFDLLGEGGLVECASEYGSPDSWLTRKIKLDGTMSAAVIYEKGLGMGQENKFLIRNFIGNARQSI